MQQSNTTQKVWHKHVAMPNNEKQATLHCINMHHVHFNHASSLLLAGCDDDNDLKPFWICWRIGGEGLSCQTIVSLMLYISRRGDGATGYYTMPKCSIWDGLLTCCANWEVQDFWRHFIHTIRDCSLHELVIYRPSHNIEQRQWEMHHETFQLTRENIATESS